MDGDRRRKDVDGMWTSMLPCDPSGGGAIIAEAFRRRTVAAGTERERGKGEDVDVARQGLLVMTL